MKSSSTQHQSAAENREQRIFLNISREGEISGWGLSAAEEQRILELTGNQDLIETIRRMSFDFCG